MISLACQTMDWFSPLSDHLPIFFPWIYSHSENFRAFLDLTDWENLDKSITSCHHMTPLLHKNLASCTIQDFLSKLYNVGTLKPFTIPWLTINSLLKSIRTKAKLFKKFLNNSNSYHENVYRAVQSKLIYLIKVAKRNYNYHKLETSNIVCNRPSGINILTGENIAESCKFSTRLPLSVKLLFCLFQA